ncbi:hypothetical protein IFM89_034152 [Coptis chinensis]|uniref:Uncharacterized protein n=1 Tax=Coptis chinensis TaxID=261450 RepID=A0A835LSE6_9MAGN|nr:hypothetical protein IFM89_034152 [Coptis chinensis]
MDVLLGVKGQEVGVDEYWCWIGWNIDVGLVVNRGEVDWAFVAIMTPTLVSLSATAKINSKDEDGVRGKARKMMGITYVKQKFGIGVEVNWVV